MSADEVISLRKLWDNFNYSSYLPEPTVLASTDWINYVQAMSELIPRDQPLVQYPTEQEAMWAWPEGVTIVLERPFPLNHTIISKQKARGYGSVETPPHQEEQILAGLVFGIGQMMPTKMSSSSAVITEQLDPPEQAYAEQVYAIPVLWIGIEPSDIVTSTWIPGGSAIVLGEEKLVSESTRFVLAVITALGHRLTQQVAIPTRVRAERRRVERELPSLRMLSLASGASVRSGEHSEVEWSHRWLVRGHWRSQPCGPSRSLRRVIWIDPFVKGPEDKPFDDRRTLWKTG